jgi:hypothetical protein
MIKPCGLRIVCCVAYPYALAILCPVASIALCSLPRLSLPASAAIAGISTSPACTPRPAPSTSLIAYMYAYSHFPLTQFHVAFAIATATICMVNCSCVAQGHVFVG